MDQFNQDLIGDGWIPIIETAPRHDDATWSNNPPKIATVKNRIRQLYLEDPSNTKSVILVGHVAIPHSGTQASDGHTCADGKRPDHRGAWPADMYYLDVENVMSWGDSFTQENCDYPQLGNLPDDGKWDLNEFPIDKRWWPYVHHPMKLPIGRIDFARLPVFSSSFPPGTDVEFELLKRYFAKNHKYRHALHPWQGSSYPDHSLSQQSPVGGVG